MFRVPFHLRIAMFLWYIYWLSSQISYIDMEAEQIKHNAISICNSSEVGVNLVLQMSHTVAVNANLKAKLEIEQFVNNTSEFVVDGNVSQCLLVIIKVLMSYILFLDNLSTFLRKEFGVSWVLSPLLVTNLLCF
jgi:hypothetical protein